VKIHFLEGPLPHPCKQLHPLAAHCPLDDEPKSLSHASWHCQDTQGMISSSCQMQLLPFGLDTKCSLELAFVGPEICSYHTKIMYLSLNKHNKYERATTKSMPNQEKNHLQYKEL
jgi:hypothetical protein